MRPGAFWCVLVLSGCTGVAPTVKNPELDVEVKGADFHELVETVSTLDLRVGKIEADVVSIREQSAAILTSSETHLKDLKALSSKIYSGSFSGSGVYALGALALVLLAQLAGFILWWKLRRDVRNNSGVTPSGGLESVGRRPLRKRSPPPGEPTTEGT